MKKLLQRLPLYLALALLTVQLLLPWTVRHFVTLDGPSHVYSAEVAREMKWNRNSIEHKVYHLRSGVLPNWTATIVLAAVTAIVGPECAERVMVDLCLLIGFLGWIYCIKNLGTGIYPITPVCNFMFNTFFLWLGFYNFVLGMALVPFLIGLFVRNVRRPTVLSAFVLSASLLLVFFTHLIAAGIAVSAVLILASFDFLRTPLSGASLRRGLTVLVVTAPTLILIVFYALGKPKLEWKPDYLEALDGFPLHVFSTSSGRVGGQTLLVPGVVLYLAVSALSLKKKEWLSQRGALICASLFFFVVYLVVPDQGLGGAMTKIRFSWAVLILGALAAESARHVWFQRPLSLYVAALLACNLFATWKSLDATSSAVADYIKATDLMPRGSTFVRIHFPTPTITSRYGLADIGRDPFFHLDAYTASRKKLIDLSDYETLNPIFPVALRSGSNDALRYALWGLEGADDRVGETLDWLTRSLPVPLDYVVVVSDGYFAGQTYPSLTKLTRKLDAEMRLATISPNAFVRVYKVMH